MAKNLLFAILFLLCSSADAAKEYDSIWKNVSLSQAAVTDGKVKAYAAYALDMHGIKILLASATAENGVEIVLPTPGGRTMAFKAWEAPMMHDQLAARYPNIKTYRAIAIDDPTVTARLDITEAGFHAMVYDGDDTYLVDPVIGNNDNYISFYKRDYVRATDMIPACQLASLSEQELMAGAVRVDDSRPNIPLKINGTLRRTYRLALGATAQYSAAVAGASLTKSNVLSAMVTTMNRVNGVFEKEVGVSMTLVPNTDDLIFLAEDDGYDNGNGTQMLTQNQTKADAIIGSANYDIGHVFSTGGGGIASPGCVCKTNLKARGVTGQSTPVGDPFDIDYVAHEMGHQFGALHTFNANFNAGSCTNNADQASAYEPGGGSTIMAYAGICGSGNNLQQRSDDYFHARSLDQITSYLAGSGSTCGAVSASNNTPPVVPAFAQSFNIPYLTPFELTAPQAIDADHDQLTYCWEEWDLGDFGESFANTNEFGPIFRSFKPVESRTRVFPALDKLLNNTTSYLGEKLPNDARILRFKLTVRDVLNGYGTFNFPTDQITLNVINTGAPFTIVAPNTSSDYWQTGSNVTVTWNVANTNASPINCSTVDILLSVDNGLNYQHVLASNTPNDGSQTITVPFAPTLTARVKVKGSNNVFFDINNAPFKINTWPAAVGDVEPSAQVDIYPVPAHDALNIYIHNDEAHNIIVTNTLGQTVLSANMKRQMDVDVSLWASGVYHVQLLNTVTQEQVTRKIVVN
ncbi:MAG: hypothetical protein K0R82_1468 [Flavipsychrobacter sp.]|jgi:hypothetical protein|nr:hypothetical protein [Flavipsychrobacter sp.]